jgi:hypothetical protein
MDSEIGEKGMEEMMPGLEEGHVYALSPFMLSIGRRGYRPIEGGLMINFMCHTIIDKAQESTFLSSRAHL